MMASKCNTGNITETHYMFHNMLCVGRGIVLSAFTVFLTFPLCRFQSGVGSMKTMALVVSNNNKLQKLRGQYQNDISLLISGGLSLDSNRSLPNSCSGTCTIHSHEQHPEFANLAVNGELFELSYIHGKKSVCYFIS